MARGRPETAKRNSQGQVNNQVPYLQFHRSGLKDMVSKEAPSPQTNNLSPTRREPPREKQLL